MEAKKVISFITKIFLLMVMLVPMGEIVARVGRGGVGFRGAGFRGAGFRGGVGFSGRRGAFARGWGRGYGRGWGWGGRSNIFLGLGFGSPYYNNYDYYYPYSRRSW